MSVLDRVHGDYVFGRRVTVLASHLAEMLPRGARVLDIGCGDGAIARAVMRLRADVSITGIDVLVRPTTHIPVTEFDGVHVPLGDGAVDTAMFVDVLHHTVDPAALLTEACRVARTSIAIKDHLRQGIAAGPTLRFMDWVGNARHGVVLPYNYWAPAQWNAAFAELGLERDAWRTQLAIYPAWADWLFGRGLHFVASLRVAARP